MNTSVKTAPKSSTYNGYSQSKTEQGQTKKYRKPKNAKYPATCIICKERLKERAEVIEVSTKSYTHLECCFKDN